MKGTRTKLRLEDRAQRAQHRGVVAENASLKKKVAELQALVGSDRTRRGPRERELELERELDEATSPLRSKIEQLSKLVDEKESANKEFCVAASAQYSAAVAEAGSLKTKQAALQSLLDSERADRRASSSAAGEREEGLRADISRLRQLIGEKDNELATLRARKEPPAPVAFAPAPAPMADNDSERTLTDDEFTGRGSGAGSSSTERDLATANQEVVALRVQLSVAIRKTAELERAVAATQMHERAAAARIVDLERTVRETAQTNALQQQDRFAGASAFQFLQFPALEKGWICVSGPGITPSRVDFSTDPRVTRKRGRPVFLATNDTTVARGLGAPV